MLSDLLLPSMITASSRTLSCSNWSWSCSYMHVHMSPRSCMLAVLCCGSAYLWVPMYNSHFNSIRVMLAYVLSGPTGSNSTLVCDTVAPGDQRSDVWHAVAHGCFPAQHQSGISSHVKQAHATWNFNADTKASRTLHPPPFPILMCWGTSSMLDTVISIPDLQGASHDGGSHLKSSLERHGNEHKGLISRCCNK